jgi:hypothetical protein
MQMDSCANWPLFLFLRLTSLQGSLYRKVTIETAPIRDDPSASMDDSAVRNQPLRVPASHHAGAHMQSRVPCDTMPLRIRLCSAAPQSRASGVQESAQKPSLLSFDQTQKHIPGFRILNLPDLIPFYQVVPIFLRANISRAMRLRSPLFLSTMSPAQHPSLPFSYPHR